MELNVEKMAQIVAEKAIQDLRDDGLFVGRWIPVSERMPEEPYGCLVTVEDEEPMTGRWFETILPYFVGWDGERWNDAEGEQCPFEVIAWMPLPESYKAESEGSMKIAIDISAEDFEKVKCGRGAVSMMRKAIIHGTPLPKGHGRLIDADEFEELFGKMCPSDCGACAPKTKTDGRGRWYDTCSLIDEAQTIIEADAESEVET